MDKAINDIILSNHEIKMIDRASIVLTGIKKIINFDNEEFNMESTMGNITLKGHNLELIKLDTHDGNVKIKGKIDSIIYNEGKKNEESLLSKLFK